MWKIRQVKKESRSALKKNYWRIVGVSLLIAFVASGLRVDMYIADAADYIAGGSFEYRTNIEIVNSLKESLTGDVDEHTVLGIADEAYTPEKGIFAKVYNRITADRSFVYGFLNSLNNMVFRDRFSEGMIILGGAVLLMLFTIGVSNVLLVGQSRFMMETLTYEKSRWERILFPWRVGRWKNTALIMGYRTVYIMLWDLTIIGGIIKRYSYAMVPYIIAENPDVTRKEAFDMSKDMMKGNKLRAFALDLSLIGWYLLAFLTFGAVKLLVVNPYRDCIYAYLYRTLRHEAQEEGREYAVYFDDAYIFVGNTLYEYPVERHKLYREETRRWAWLDYHRSYSLQSYVLMFFTFSIIGWMWEVSLHLFGDGVFINRGFFHGPWLPIYGTGGVLIIALIKRFADRPVITFAGAVAVAGTVEYFTAWLLWETQHKYWWNYSGYFLNLHGRICAEGLVVFGIGGLAFIYLLAPVCDEIFRRIRPDIRRILCIVLIVLFIADTAWSVIEPNQGKGITDYKGTAAAVTMEK